MVIDVWNNIFTPDGIRKYFVEPEGIRFAFELFHREHLLVGYSPEEFVKKLDEAGVDKIVIPSFKVKKYRSDEMLQDCPTKEVAEVVLSNPDRFIGMVGIKPFPDIMAAVRDLETGVKDYGFRGAHIHPYGFGVPIHDKIYYPVYAKCAELGVPVAMQIGHSAELMPSSVGHPLLIDDIALDFPTLKIIGMHTGWPWTETMIAMAWKHPNVYVATTAHAPRYWEPSLIHFINTRGKDKVLFGTDYPVLQHQEALKQIEELDLKPEAKRKLLGENAARVFGLG